MKIRQKLAVGCTAAVLGVSAAGASVALADSRVVSGNDTNLVAENVNKEARLSLTVRKVATNPYDDVPEGAKPSAIAGAQFTLSRVEDIDVTTSAGREAAKGFSLDDVASHALISTTTRTTDGGGVANFTNLVPGLYLLEESAPDADYNYHLSSPKLIILPLGSASGEGFEYENVVVTKPEPDRPPSTTTRTRPPETVTTTPGTETETTRVTTPTSSVAAPPTTVTSTPPATVSTVTTTPVRPPATTTVSTPGDKSRDGGLASTGANVLWLAGIAVILILGGFFLARRNNDGQQ